MPRASATATTSRSERSTIKRISGIGPPFADRHAGQRADAAERGDEEELGPHRAMDVLRDVRLHAGAQKRFAEPFDALGAAVVELSEHHERLGRRVADVSRLDDETDDAAETAEDVLGRREWWRGRPGRRRRSPAERPPCPDRPSAPVAPRLRGSATTSRSSESRRTGPRMRNRRSLSPSRARNRR